MHLWQHKPPYTLGDREQDRPFMEIFFADPEKATGSAMLILPGGAYTFLSEKSGAQYGRWLAAEGITGCVVHFRLGSNGYRYQAILADALRALALVRAHADDWSIDPHRVGVIGTSAGGHLASLLLTRAGIDSLIDCPSNELDLQGNLPALGVLCYAVISLQDPIAHRETRHNLLAEQDRNPVFQQLLSAHLHVRTTVPPCFIWHTIEDEEVPVEHSRLFAEALHAHHRSYELHLYEKGAHALGLARNEGLCWSNDCIRWLRSHGF